MLTSNEVSRANFTNRVSQEGYDIFEVNEFLRAVGSTLSRLESGYTTGGDGSRLLEPNDVRKIDFTATIFRDGYDVTEVDALLDEVKEALETYVRRATSTNLPVAGPATSEPLHYDVTVPTQDAAPPASAAPEDETAPPDEPTPAGMPGGEVQRQLIYTRATMFGDARETLTVRTPDGHVFGVARIERTDDGVVVHVE